MGTTYTRQSSIADGDTITAALFNNEYNQILNAFVYASSGTTGHQHDGTSAEGGNIHTIGDQDFLNKIVADSTNNRWGVFVEVSSAAVEQIRIADGVVSPVTDSDVDIGTSSLYFKDAYIDSITTTGNITVGGNLAVTGTTTFNGGTLTLGDSASDNVVFGADVNSNIIPNTDSAYDLGSASQEWRDLYLDGTAHIDTLDVDINATVAGTLGVTGVLTTTATQVATGGITSGSDIISDTDSTDSLGSTSVRWLKGWFDTLTAGTLTIGSGSVTDSSGAISFGNENLTTTGIVTAAGTSVFTNLDISGDIDVDGTTNLDVVDIDGAVDMASTLAVAGVLTGASLDISGDIDIDGTSNLDIVDIDGAVDMASTLGVTGVATLASLVATTADINAGTIDGVTLGTNSAVTQAVIDDIDLNGSY